MSTNNKKRINGVPVVWGPVEGSSQITFLLSGKRPHLVKRVLYHGGRGFGKSECLIASFLQHVGKGWGRWWSGVILRLEISALDDLIDKSMDIIPLAFPDATYNKTKRRWTFATGERLTFDFCKDKRDYDRKWHGKEIQFLGMDELSTWKDMTVMEAMQSLLRHSYEPTQEQPEDPPMQERYSTNPYGIGKGWVKDYFDISDATAGKIKRDKNGRPVQMHIYGYAEENTYLPQEYLDWLYNLKDPVVKEAWLYGNWESVDFAAIFGGMWSSYIAIDPFVIPHTWDVHRCFDYGTASPFACLWVAEANGEEIRLKDGTRFCPPAGSLIVVAEDYGTEEQDGNQLERNKGLNMSARAIARRLKAKEEGLERGLLKDVEIQAGPADNQIFNGKNIDKGRVPTIAKEMEKEGIDFINSDKSPGSRANSAQLMVERLDATREQDLERPHIYIFKSCKYSLKFLPELHRDDNKPDEVKKGPDDHIWDALAYRLTMKPQGKVDGFNLFG